MAESADHITCQELVETVNDYLEGELPVGDVELVEQHLNYCAGCESYVAQLRITVETVGRIRKEDVPEPLRERLRSAFRDRSRS
jgi:hypothetical protein